MMVSTVVGHPTNCLEVCILYNVCVDLKVLARSYDSDDRSYHGDPSLVFIFRINEFQKVCLITKDL